MNRFAYLTSGFAIKMLSGLTRAKIHMHGQEQIPEGAIIYAINHFTRIETLILPCYIHELTGHPVWSLADFSLFKGALAAYFEQVGVVSTRDPDRDMLIVKTLLGGEASWIIFPEGRMVKDKKIIHRGRFMITDEKRKRPPHTGAAALALRTEFYRQRLARLLERSPEGARQLMDVFDITDPEPVISQKTYIVPVNLTYYPLRAQENIISKLAVNFVETIDERTLEEIMTEGSMLLSGVDVDIRFGAPIPVQPFLERRSIQRALDAREESTPTVLPDRFRKRLRRTARRIMQQYMAAIYDMTTVNHDHLFASILKQMPYRMIRPDDLRRRVFLAASMDFQEAGVFFHRYLEMDQAHLLTDDRYNTVRDFLVVALETGIIRETSGGQLRKNRSRFSGGFNFHQIRIDNPVSVIANEVEPLRRLQKRLQWLAWLPSFWIRRKTIRFLQHQAAAEFENDYEEFYHMGKAKPPTVGAPFLIKGETRAVGVLLIHDFLAAPLEMDPLANHLERRGIGVYAPRLRGHGTQPEDLALWHYEDWIASVDAGFALIRELCRKVVVGGFAAGAALALDLAARTGQVAGVFAVSPPQQIQDLSLKKHLTRDIWNRVTEMIRLPKRRDNGYLENTPENPNISYPRTPLSAVREMELFLEQLFPKLPDIAAPSLVIHTARDPVALPEHSRQIFEKIGAEDKQYLLFNFDRHGILHEEGAERIHRVIGDFVERFV